jgi:hypothetical protein
MNKYLSESPIWLEPSDKIRKLEFKSVLIYNSEGNRFEAILELEPERAGIIESARVALKVKQLAGFEEGKACYSYLYLTEKSIGQIDLKKMLPDQETLIINLYEEEASL